MGATEKIARFIVNTGYEDIPDDAVEKAKRTALDCLGATLAGVVEPVSQTITAYIAKLGGPTQASVIGAGFKVSAPDAALANGAIAHALDYDDCGVKIGHPSVLVLPALLSLGEYLGASGRDTLTAYILGLEVEGKLALHADFKLMQSRLNHQSWYGSVGAAAACAKLLRLDVARTRMALGIAANFACGLSANHGSMAGAMAAANACRNGVIAALMAQEGITANPDIIEAKNGFYDTLVGRDHYDAEGMAEGVGNPFYIVSPGIGLKKYPSCYHTHRALDGVFQLLGEHRLSDSDIAEVDVGTSERAMRVLAFSEPATPVPSEIQHALLHCRCGGGPSGDARHFHISQVRRSQHRRDQEESSPFFPRRPHLARPRGCRPGYRVRRQSGDYPDDRWAKLQRTGGHTSRRSHFAADRRRATDQVPGLCAQPAAPRRHRAQRRPGSGARDGGRYRDADDYSQLALARGLRFAALIP